MSTPLIFPNFDPVALHLGSLAIRWYALAYIVAFILALPLAKRLMGLTPKVVGAKIVDDFLFYAVLGVLLGGRLGYVFFYQPVFFLAHPLQIFETWKGGMSFHGGALGVICALGLFTWRHRIPFLFFADRIAVVVPIGLALGRCANFINGELWGRVVESHVPWAMIFPRIDSLPRHPSELYEAFCEGIVLFIIMFSASRSVWIRQHGGFLSGLFIFGYGIARGGCEFFREPDMNIGFLFGGITMGQLLCLPMILVGASLLFYASRQTAMQQLSSENLGENVKEGEDHA